MITPRVLVCLFFLYCPFSSAELTKAYEIALDRAVYSDALYALKKGDAKKFTRLRQELVEKEYPLVIYLDYRKISGSLSGLNLEKAKERFQHFENTPIQKRFWRSYLDWLGRAKRWDNFLAFYELMPEGSLTETLRCYHARALRGSGKLELAWLKTKELWVHGGSRPTQCDPVFKLWFKSSAFNDSAVKGRVLAAFRAGNRGLMNYAGRLGSQDLGDWTTMVKRVYSKPQRIDRYDLAVGDPFSSELITVALAKLAKTDPRDTLAIWKKFLLIYKFTSTQTDFVEEAIARSLIRSAPQARKEWLLKTIASPGRGALKEGFLRGLISEKRWKEILSITENSSASHLEKPLWVYWRGRAEHALGEKENAKETFRTLAKTRHYYGFLAADQLGQSYDFNDQKIEYNEAVFNRLKTNNTFRRLEELRFHKEVDLARQEWRRLLSNLSTSETAQLLLFAMEQRWGNWPILAAKKDHGENRLYNALNIRFPIEYLDLFAKHAQRRNLSTIELLSIARRESAFNPSAGSSAGARGLMQLMPSTAKLVAKEARIKFRNSYLVNPDKNVELGSIYYKNVLKKYKGNRIFALAAYNAGPSAVKRWRRKSNRKLDAAAWVEVIPYKETRDYVQAVLAYRSVYAHKLGQPTALMSDLELKGKY